MPRTGRLELPGVPLHVRHRGNNRAACFFNDVDRRFYLKCLAQAAGRHGCAVHAYVLMPNHVHLLLTPSAIGATGRMMQDIGRRYVRVINTVHGRTGTLWEGRFRSSLVQDERYLLNVHRYIERNPIRAGLARLPGDYAWCSYGHYSGTYANPLITEHATFRALGPTLTVRRAAFCELFAEDLDAHMLKQIRDAIDTETPMGAQIRRRGRPRNEKEKGGAPPVITGKLF